MRSQSIDSLFSPSRLLLPPRPCTDVVWGKLRREYAATRTRTLLSIELFSKGRVFVSSRFVWRLSFIPFPSLALAGSSLPIHDASFCIKRSENSSRQSRRITTPPVPLRPIKPLPLTSASLKVRRDGSDVLPAGNHGAAHFVAVSVHCDDRC